MTNKTQQLIFKSRVVEQMRIDLHGGKSLIGYLRPDYNVDKNDLLPSTVGVFGKEPKLIVPKADPVSADVENAIALHEYYKGLNETQASDSRLWAYLSHVQFRKYTMARWGLNSAPDELKNDKDKRIKATNYIVEHWFAGGNDRDLRRHAIARLWWAAHLTFAPWEHDPDFFGSLKKDDPYHYTRILFLTQDIYQQVLERAMGRSDRILICVLDYLDENPDFANSREKVRGLMKGLNLAYGTKKLIALDRESLQKVISRVAGDAERISAEAHEE